MVFRNRVCRRGTQLIGALSRLGHTFICCRVGVEKAGLTRPRQRVASPLYPAIPAGQGVLQDPSPRLPPSPARCDLLPVPDPGCRAQ